MNLAVVIPVYNEQACIDKVVQSWTSMLKEIAGAALLVVNDGSTDATRDQLGQLAEKNPQLRVIDQRNGGHGKAVLTGYREALKSGADWIFQCDSDDQIEADEFWKLWHEREKSPFILGYRKNRHDPIHRLVITLFHRLLIAALFGRWIKDANVPFRLMKTDTLAKLLAVLNVDVFAPNLMLSVLARGDGIATLDIEVQHKIRETGVPSLKPLKLARVCLRCVREMLSLRLRTLST